MNNFKDLKYTSVGNRFEASPESIATSVLLKAAIENGGKCVSKFYKEGYTDKPFVEILKVFEDLGGKKIFEYVCDKSEEYIYLWDDAIVELYCATTKSISIHSVSSNEKITNAAKEIAKLFEKKSKKGYVFAISKGQSGLEMLRVGYAGQKLERENYTESVLKDYDFAVEDLKSKNGTGNILIFEGPPGGGKTYLIRGILLDISNAMFVIISPSMISSIIGPDFIPLLLQTKEDYKKKGPIILLIEDADAALAPRESDNIALISGILNISDGILGSLFNLKIVATTNSEVKNIDKAILRDGRLSKRISLKPHSYNDANTIYRRLLKDDTVNIPKIAVDEIDRMKPLKDKSTYMLAEIYKLARNNGWKPENNSEQEEADFMDELYHRDEDFF